MMPRNGVLIVATCTFATSCGSDGEPAAPEAPTAPTVAQIRAVSGDSQTGTVDTPLGAPLVVEVLLQNGAPAPGVPLTWSTESGTFTAQSAQTDANGRGSATWTLGQAAGSQTARVNVGSLAADFQATAEPDVPVEVTVDVSSVLLDKWGDRQALSAAARDRFGNPVPDVPFAWESDDEQVVRVGADGVLTSHAAGEALVTVRAKEGAVTDLASSPEQSGSVASSVSVEVAFQRNSLCVPPMPPPTPGPVAGPPTFIVGEEDMGLPPMETWPGAQNIFGVGGDFDGDGREDLMFFHFPWGPPFDPAAGFTFFFRNEGGTLVDRTDGVFVGGAPAVGMTFRSLVSDLNGDGVDDLVIIPEGWDGPDPQHRGDWDLLFLSQPGGLIAEAGRERLVPNHPRSSGSGSAVGDVDCDGDMDFYISHVDHPPNDDHLYINSGGGFFTAENSRLPNGINDLKIAGAAMCDLDGDGDPELLLGHLPTVTIDFHTPLPPPEWAADGIVILVNDGFGNFRPAPRELQLPTPWGPETMVEELVCADLDLDGRPDIVVQYQRGTTGAGPGRWAFFRNLGDMVFEDVTALWFPNDYLAGGMFVRDFNGDGWPDILATRTPGDSPQLLLVNQGPAQPFLVQSLDFLKAEVPSALGWPIDLDGDGRLDFVVYQRKWMWPGSPPVFSSFLSR